jgi:hypothetical protein
LEIKGIKVDGERQSKKTKSVGWACLYIHFHHTWRGKVSGPRRTGHGRGEEVLEQPSDISKCSVSGKYFCWGQYVLKT